MCTIEERNKIINEISQKENISIELSEKVFDSINDLNNVEYVSKIEYKIYENFFPEIKVYRDIFDFILNEFSVEEQNLIEKDFIHDISKENYNDEDVRYLLSIMDHIDYYDVIVFDKKVLTIKPKY